ncbi:NAD(P)H-dependent oxidoreductase [Propionibacterium sp.]|uniref:NAD(P)H-dependent oxidoreductase n=1 Tax=Propionibacterium sp. TaxID=1977903 RepID=UPI0039E8F1B8
MSIIAITSGLGSPSASRMLTDRLIAALREADPHGILTEDIQVVELRDIAHDLLNTELSHVPAPSLTRLSSAIEQADGVIAVAPVYNAQPAAVFSLLLEVLDEGILRGKPVLLGATGGSPRHSLVLDRAMVPLFHYVHALIAPVSVFASTDDWADDALASRCRLAAQSFLALFHPATRPSAKPRVPDAEDLPASTEASTAGEVAAPSNGSTSAELYTLDADFETMMRSVEAGGTATRTG